MKKLLTSMFLFAISAAAFGQIAPMADPNQAAMLESDDPELAANKRFVYDFWREVLEARHVEFAEKYMAEDYIQHNPNVPTGRAPFVQFFGSQPAVPIQDTIQRELITIMAERDLVTLLFAQEYENPNAPGEKYKTTWVDTFRVTDGKIVEHWDSALISPR